MGRSYRPRVAGTAASRVRRVVVELEHGRRRGLGHRLEYRPGHELGVGQLLLVDTGLGVGVVTGVEGAVVNCAAVD